MSDASVLLFILRVELPATPPLEARWYGKLTFVQRVPRVLLCRLQA